MNLIHTTFLTPLQKQDIHLLEFSCKQAEPLSLSAPTEDGLDYFLFYQDSRLAGMLYLFFSEPVLCECSGFVLPDLRRQGIFSRLLECMTDFLEHLEDQTGEDIECCFLCDEAAPSAKSLLKALECELWYSEYKMECSLRAPYFFPCSAKEPTVSDSHPPLRLIQKILTPLLHFWKTQKLVSVSYMSGKTMSISMDSKSINLTGNRVMENNFFRKSCSAFPGMVMNAWFFRCPEPTFPPCLSIKKQGST